MGLRAMIAMMARASSASRCRRSVLHPNCPRFDSHELVRSTPSAGRGAPGACAGPAGLAKAKRIAARVGSRSVADAVTGLRTVVVDAAGPAPWVPGKRVKPGGELTTVIGPQLPWMPMALVQCRVSRVNYQSTMPPAGVHVAAPARATGRRPSGCSRRA